ncbi:MAG: hypothetical protein RL186_123 [Pseudomonadota bacterium]|jgi:hypothetical protein
MTCVFLSGSRKIGALPDKVIERLHNMVANDIAILLGDANGADTAMQTYFHAMNYTNVTIFHVGKTCRNNVGGWKTHSVVDAVGKSGREFYTQKDKAMAKMADLGFVVWDGMSAGSITNVFELVSLGKKAVVYSQPEHAFFNVTHANEAISLLKLCSPALVRTLRKSLGNLNDQSTLQIPPQAQFAF